LSKDFRLYKYVVGIKKPRGKDTGGSHALLEIYALAGSEPPAHTHQREDEILFMLAGSRWPMHRSCEENEGMLDIPFGDLFTQLFEHPHLAQEIQYPSSQRPTSSLHSQHQSP